MKYRTMDNVQKYDNYACTIREGTTGSGKTLFEGYITVWGLGHR
jgi:hypothetical protein